MPATDPFLGQLTGFARRTYSFFVGAGARPRVDTWVAMAEDPQVREDTARSGRVTPDQMFRAAKRWGVVVIAAAALAGGGAFAVSQAVHPEYEATAQLFLTPASSTTAIFQDVVLGQNLARSYVQLVEAEVVLRPAMETVSWSDLRTFRERTTATQVRDTSIITVSFKDGDAGRAAAAANAIARSFIDQSRSLQSTLQDTTATQLDEQAASLRTEMAALDSQIAGLRSQLAVPGGNATTRAEQQTQLVQLEVSRLAKQQSVAQLVKTADDIRLAGARGQSAVNLWQPAVAPTEPVSPRVGLNTLVGAFAGALLAILGIAVIRYLDDRMRDIESVRAQLGVPGIAEVARAPRSPALAGKLFVRDEPASVAAEEFRSLRTNISFANVDRRPQSILITSALPLEGKSVVSANLALAFAQAGVPTILVDADLRRPTQHQLFKVGTSIGLTSLLAGTVPVTSIQQFRVGPQLIVIPSGPLPPNPAELLSSNRMTALVRELTSATEGGVVVIDTSPMLAVTDAAALASKVDGCLLVVDSSRTHARSARRALESLRRVRATVLGVVLNKVDEGQASYHYYKSAEDPQPPAPAASIRANEPTAH